ncbi:hypothetical protein R6Q59_014596 [Mikania micrantha]
MDRGSYQTNDMISKKWRDLQHIVAKFNRIWVQHHNNRKSVENDGTVMNVVLTTYAKENKPFSHITACQPPPANPHQSSRLHEIKSTAPPATALRAYEGRIPLFRQASVVEFGSYVLNLHPYEQQRPKKNLVD